MAHTVHHIQTGEVHIDGGRNSVHLRVFGGPDVSLVVTAPIFDTKALHSLPDLQAYVEWLTQLADMHKANTLQEKMLLLGMDYTMLALCISRVPCPVLCAWKDTYHHLQQSEAARNSFLAIHTSLCRLTDFIDAM